VERSPPSASPLTGRDVRRLGDPQFDSLTMVTLQKSIYVEGTYEALHSRVEALESRLENLGLRAPGSSRLGSYRRILRRLAEAPRELRADDEYRLAHRAILECSQLLLIVSELSRPPEVPNWLAKTQQVLAGHKLPHTEVLSSSARDIQFELYLAGLARRAGYGVTLDEPDVVIRAHDCSAGIAAKRLKSRQKLRRSLRSASTQIARAGLDGFIALDLSMLLLPQEEPLVVGDFPAAKDTFSAILSQFLHPNALDIRSSVDWTRAYGLLAVITGLSTFSESGKLAAVFQCRALNLCSEHDPRCKRIEALVEKLGAIHID
jgi:hypothetical protein